MGRDSRRGTTTWWPVVSKGADFGIVFKKKKTYFHHINFFSETIGYLKKNPHARDKLPSYKLLIRETPKAPQTTQAVDIAVDCPLEPYGKALLLS